MECRNIGILGRQNGKRHLLKIMLNLHLLMTLVRRPFSTFRLENSFIMTRKQSSYMHFDLFFKPIIP